jgi:putative inorganic carbon (hco3(-)) transporter
MRDLVLGPIILGIAAYGLLHPWLGVLGWTWISIMNPHAMSWRLHSQPVAALVAVSILVGLMVTKDRRNIFVTRETIVLMLFMAWMCITLPFSYHVDASFVFWKRVMKIDFMILVSLVVLYSRMHIIALAWVLAASIGFFGIKGGLFTLASGGGYRVWGPPGGYIEGNNEIGLAMVMAIPLMYFLYVISLNIWVKRALLATMVLSAFAILGTQSRGALLAIAAMGAVLWWRSRNKLPGLIVLAALAVALLTFMPETWWDRMATIGTYQDDGSAMGRIHAWTMAWNIAKDNLFGAGFVVAMADVCARYSPLVSECRAAHSIYFMVLGEHGFIGLALFLLMWILVWGSAGHLRIQGKKQPETMWVSHLGAMCQVSLAGYAVGGAFLSLSYYDFPYNILVLVVLSRRWMESKVWVSEAHQQLTRQAELATKGKTPSLLR